MMATPRSGSARRRIAALALAGAVAAVAAGVWLVGARENADVDRRADREHPIVTAARVVVRDGRTVIRLDEQAMRRAGIRTEPVVRSAQPEALRAFASVVDVQPLAQAAASLATAAAQAQAARARLAASRAEYERSKSLFDQDQTVSASQVQSSQAVFLADQAASASAQSQVQADVAGARLQWGPVLGDAMGGGNSSADGPIRDLLERRQVLLQVVVPPEAAASRAPASGRVMLDDGAVPAPILRYLSPSPRADARLAGRGYFYLATAHPALVAGAGFPVQLPTGRTVEAARLPASSLVWWQGRAWVFVRAPHADFERREVPMDAADAKSVDGIELRAGLDPGTEVVVQGAQVLLSEELRAENFSTDVGGR